MKWLSIYDVSVSTSHKFVAYLVFYYGFLILKDKEIYESRLELV